MRLQDDFYTILRAAPADGRTHYDLRLDPAHPIYRAHFPGQPVTPGVCLIRIVQELAAHEIGRPLALRHVDKARFLHTLDPREHAQVQVSLALSPLPEGGWQADADISAGETLFTRMRLGLA